MRKGHIWCPGTLGSLGFAQLVQGQPYGSTWKKLRLWTSALPFPSLRRPAQVGDPGGFLRFQVGMLKCRGMSLSGGRWAGASTAELLQLNYMQEVENNHVSVPHCLQGASSRAGMGKSCWRAQWDYLLLLKYLQQHKLVGAEYLPCHTGDFKAQNCASGSGVIVAPVWLWLLHPALWIFRAVS